LRHLSKIVDTNNVGAIYCMCTGWSQVLEIVDSLIFVKETKSTRQQPVVHVHRLTACLLIILFIYFLFIKKNYF